MNIIKELLSIVLMVSLLGTSSCLTNKELGKVADDYYEVFAYEEAAILYERQLGLECQSDTNCNSKKDSLDFEIKEKLCDCYLKTNQLQKLRNRKINKVLLCGSANAFRLDDDYDEALRKPVSSESTYSSIKINSFEDSLNILGIFLWEQNKLLVSFIKNGERKFKLITFSKDRLEREEEITVTKSNLIYFSFYKQDKTKYAFLERRKNGQSEILHAKVILKNKRLTFSEISKIEHEKYKDIRQPSFDYKYKKKLIVSISNKEGRSDLYNCNIKFNTDGKPELNSIKPLKLNSKNNDYNPFIFENLVYYTSESAKIEETEKRDDRIKANKLDIYRGSISDTTPEQEEYCSKNTNRESINSDENEFQIVVQSDEVKYVLSDRDSAYSKIYRLVEIPDTTIRKFALIVAISEYAPESNLELEPLNNSKRGKKLKTILEKSLEFKEIKVLPKDTEKSLFINILNEFASKIDSNDNLLIYFDGHGLKDNPSIAFSNKKFPNDENKFLLRYDTIHSILEKMEAKHVLLILNACFSGGVGIKKKMVTNNPVDTIDTINPIDSLAVPKLGENREEKEIGRIAIVSANENSTIFDVDKNFHTPLCMALNILGEENITKFSAADLKTKIIKMQEDLGVSTSALLRYFPTSKGSKDGLYYFYINNKKE